MVKISTPLVVLLLFMIGLETFYLNLRYLQPALQSTTNAGGRDKAIPTTINSTAKAIHVDRPLLILHVGPGKTGTTSIQEILAKKWSKNALLSDHYLYIGNNGGILEKSQSYQCAGRANKSICNLSSKLTDLVRYNENQPTNLVGSNEFLANLNSTIRRAWVDATRDKWDVRIVVSYRRFHELLPSNYNQHFKKTRIPAKKSVDGHHNWPGIGGNIRVPSLPEYLLSKINDKEFESFNSYQAWSEDFPNNATSVFHFHQEGDLTTNFVCQAIPCAQTMCDQMTKKTIARPLSNSNRSTNYLGYDILAVYAYEQGLVHEFYNRYSLAMAIGKHHKEWLLSGGTNSSASTTTETDIDNLHLPMVCLNADALAKLYEISLWFELWAKPFAPKPTTDFDASWNATLDKQTLCSVDAAKALEQVGWKEFFHSRYSKNKKQKIMKKKESAHTRKKS
mmetsp:Transcript_17846/g.20548  ORF Transcript_17846/g.20548 Transcript_17846/m.20548 type:complete len:450 (+) Transcript_17846:248-1597(+)